MTNISMKKKARTFLLCSSSNHVHVQKKVSRSSIRSWFLYMTHIYLLLQCYQYYTMRVTHRVYHAILLTICHNI